ncbi:ATP-dependent DNA helicase [Acetivibrio cellulolyticus]|uniref:ATP-dependent DNA helicase n=1 Tax=Acetivibrio cellulolyticus TaxID=35830 RepID=UPI0001E2CBF4|nr:ATP-dependent DNA helicase [Acetivibrio cellulolyticus]
MFKIDTSEEAFMLSYFERHRDKKTYRYLFTFDKNYIIVVKENKSINSYFVICRDKDCIIPLLKSKKAYTDEYKDILINRFTSTSDYQVTLPENPNTMIEYIFKKLMPESGFKIREEQIELSLNMYTGIKNNCISICEAEVGTGKTYAYIVAAVVYALYERQSRKGMEIEESIPCVISTSSIDLQNAIINNYIPTLSEILYKNRVIKCPLSAVLRKGKEHYFCKMRYERLVEYLRSSKKTADRELLEKLNSFNLGNSIDLDEYKGLKNHIVQKINVPKNCEKRCPAFKECEYIKYMEYVKQPFHDFQVCNHNYYLADAVKRAKGRQTLIPEHSIEIIDEAHKLTDAATQILGKSFQSEDITLMTNMIRSILKGKKAYLNSAKLKLERLCVLRTRFFRHLISKNREIIDDDISQIAVTIDLCEKEILVEMLLQISNIKDYCSTDISKSRELGMMVLEIEQQIENILKTNDVLYWLENPGSESLVAVCCIPIDLEYQLYQVLWRNGIPKIVTSGTLSDDIGFDYFKRNTGIDLITSSKTSEISYLSPFDYNKNALLYISQKVPFPDKQCEEYIKAVAEEIINLVDATCGHTVILFTSYTLLSKVYELARSRIKYPLLKMDKSQKNIVDAFKNSGNGVLFATGSFWEGVDCPGDILSSLIIVNLPFPIPSPIVEYKKEQFDTMEEFIDTIVFPEMIIKLKQGMGRLIRCETDTGIIAVLDFRVSKNGKYRKRVLKALSHFEVTDSIDDVRDFIGKVKEECYFKDDGINWGGQ